jgi:pimeloyl-ACP methyl ester carboxylesterase
VTVIVLKCNAFRATDHQKSECKGYVMDVLFVPGLNCTGALFTPQVNALEPRFRCHIADHSVADSLEAIAADILTKAPAHFSLVGLSMGGYVAYEIIRQVPGRVLSLALLDTRAEPDTEEDASRRRQTIELARGGRFDRLHGILWPRLVHPARLADKKLEETVTGMMRDTGAERFIRQQTAVLNRIDYRPELAGIAIPSTIIVGAQDVITPPEHAKALNRAIKGSRYVEIDDCGHLSSLERPEVVNDALLRLLNENIASSH